MVHGRKGGTGFLGEYTFDKFCQPLKGKVQSTDITTNSIKDVSIRTPILKDIGGNAVVMAICAIDIQLAWNNMGADAAYVIGAVGEEAFAANADFDMSLDEVIVAREVFVDAIGASTGAIVHEQMAHYEYPIPFLYAKSEIHFGIENKQATAVTLTGNFVVWYNLVTIKATELLGLLA